MKLVDISLSEDAGFPRRREPVKFGVPLAAGKVKHASLLKLYDGEELVPLDTTALQYWPDGSVRWCLLEALVSVGAGEQKQLALCILEQPPLTPQITVSDVDESRWLVDTGSVQFHVDGAQHRVTFEGSVAGVIEPPELVLDGQNPLLGKVTENYWSGRGAQASITLTQHGAYRDRQEKEICRFESQLVFFALSARVEWRFTLHNPRSAQHPGGLWDLGDPNSLRFKKLSLPVSLPDASHIKLQVDAGKEWSEAVSELLLFQASSGGDNWNSRNHVDSDNQIKLPFRGYKLDLDGEPHQDDRSSPLLLTDTGVAVYPECFWQNFPKAIKWSRNKVVVALFPEECSYTHELQPGERKTHQVSLDFAVDELASGVLRSPVNVTIPADYTAQTSCVQHFTARQEPLDSLIQTGLSESLGFLAKREIIDEYGWRHFGDIFADHESLYLTNGDLFISHYNNQYDPLYGFLRQFLLTGERQWMQMADELARHVCDIDIYSTVEDRAEYNGGLFWHTDHYVDAFTAGHRTYSRLQKPDGIHVTEGGGPGAEHCYTHGLMLHYCLTGNSRSREAVLQLTGWITGFYEGSGTFLERLLDFKNRVLPQVRYAENPERILFHKYPFNRGVGNYVNALLDSLAVTNDRRYLQRAEQVIAATFNPEDEVEDRNLKDVESTWFYTIFLQSVIRFLEVKKQYGETDTLSFTTALKAFMKYAEWVQENEKPYLSEPEILDFPNDTWVAQDMRKACILFYAGAYAESEMARSGFVARANEFYSGVVETLAKSDTQHFSRILAILMQNHGVHGFFANSDLKSECYPAAMAENGSPYRGRREIVINEIRELLSALLRFSLRKELRWLGHRHGGFARLYAWLYRVAAVQEAK